jgi:hypothetical protein
MSKLKYAGMTANERLFEARLIDEFDAAALGRDRARMVEILRKVEMGEGAENTADVILASPAKYGF